MNTDIGFIHHVGHVVSDIETARAFYQKLGFLVPAPAYPTLARSAGEPPRPFGAANMHAAFARNFIEIMAVVGADSRFSADARPIPLQVPPAALPQVVESIERTIARLAASLARFEGLHILVFQTADAAETARRFDQAGVGHSGVNRVQQPGQRQPIGVIEIDREVTPEGRLAAAESPVFETPPPAPQHPNGALDLVESLLCVPDAELDAYAERYQRYLGRAARGNGAARVFDLQGSAVRLIPARALGALLPGECAPELPAFASYTVSVRDVAATRRLLEQNGLPVEEAPAGGIFVPAQAALGAAVVFREASSGLAPD